MSLNVKESNGRKIYFLAENKSFSEYLKEYKSNIKELKRKSDYLKSFELIQDFSFPVASKKVLITKDK